MGSRYTVTTPYQEFKHDQRLSDFLSVIDQREEKLVRALKVGEHQTFPRNFGARSITIHRTK